MDRARTLVMVIAVLLLCAGAAQANPINDPVIIVRGGTGTIDLTSLVTNLAYPGQVGCSSGPYPTGTFPPNPLYVGLQSMTCVFKNKTGVPITSLTFNITSAQLPLTLLCSVLCSSFTQTPSGGVATFIFSTPIPNSPPPFEVAIDFINFDPNNTSFVMIANAPEPASMLLLATGLGALLARRRKAKA